MRVIHILKLPLTQCALSCPYKIVNYRKIYKVLFLPISSSYKMEYKKFHNFVQKFLLILVLLMSLSAVAAATNTQITVDFLEGSGIGLFKEVGFYEIENGQLVRYPITVSYELRDVPGQKTYSVIGAHTTSRMYVKSEVNGVLYYWYTDKIYNSDGNKHFQSGNNYFWFDNYACSGCSCDYDDFGFQLIGISQYNLVCNTNADCPATGVSNSYCDGNSVYQNKQTSTCNNAGTQNSYCSTSSTPEFVAYCSYGCDNGQCLEYTDTTGPVVTLLSPLDGSRHTSEITFEYKATDESGVERCTLGVNTYGVNTRYNLVNNQVYSYSLTPSEYGEHTAEVVCYDSEGNWGRSAQITFYYDLEPVEPECSNVRDCGETITEYFCEGNGLIKRVTRPTCEGGTCGRSVTETKVRECSRGCLNGRCISGGGGNNNNDVCDGLDCNPIINFAYGRYNDDLTGSVLYYDEQTTQTDKQTTDEIGIDYFVLLLIILIGAIAVLILMIIYFLGRKPKKKKRYVYPDAYDEYYPNEQYYNNPVNPQYGYERKF